MRLVYELATVQSLCTCQEPPILADMLHSLQEVHQSENCPHPQIFCLEGAYASFACQTRKDFRAKDDVHAQATYQFMGTTGNRNVNIVVYIYGRVYVFQTACPPDLVYLAANYNYYTVALLLPQ